MSTEAKPVPAPPPAQKRREKSPSAAEAEKQAPPMGGTTPEERRTLLKSMLLQRRFEERCAEAYALGKVGGFCHLYIGQEAISTGTMSR